MSYKLFIHNMLKCIALVSIIALSLFVLHNKEFPNLYDFSIARTDAFIYGGYGRDLIWIAYEWEIISGINYERSVSDNPKAQGLTKLLAPGEAYPNNPDPLYFVSYLEGTDVLVSSFDTGPFKFDISDIKDTYSDRARNTKRNASHSFHLGPQSYWNGQRHIENIAYAAGTYQERQVTNGLHVDSANCKFGVWEATNLGPTKIVEESYTEYYLYIEEEK